MEVSEKVFMEYLNNLVGSLNEEGFNAVYVATPYGTNLQTNLNQFNLIAECYAQLPLLLPDFSQIDKVLIIPTGHTEQHSLHLPMSTDTMIIDSIAKGVVNEIRDSCSMLPVMPYGVSTHRSSFCGTFNAGGRAFEDFYLEIIDTMFNLGYDRFYFLNGHGGNDSFLTNIVKYAGEEFTGIFCAKSWLYLSGPTGVSSIERYRDTTVGGMGHAGELETSLMLHINPDLVHMDRVVDDIDFITTPSYYMDWIEGGSLSANPPWYDDSIFGAYGAGSFGTAEKGSQWLKDAITEKVSHIHEINQQQNERKKRRSSGYGKWGQI
ncbi:creatininase family protein [Chloroflexota bacterium]